MLQSGEIKFNFLEDFCGRPEHDLRPSLFTAIIYNFQILAINRLAIGELHRVYLSVAPDRQVETRRQPIDDRDAHTMQTAGNFIRVLVKFPACMKLRHNDLCGGNPFFRMYIDGNTPPIIIDCNRPFAVQRDRDPGSMTGHSFVDRIVHDFINHVVETGAVFRIADIHAGSFANRFEPT